MYALASLGLRIFCVADGGQYEQPRGRMYTDVYPDVPWGSAFFAWQALDNVHYQGVGCTPWRPSGSASFAWQACDNVYCQGSDVRNGVRRAPCLLRDRRGTMSIAKGSDARPGVPWGSAFFAWQAWNNMSTQGGSDLYPSVPRAPSLLRGPYRTIYTTKDRIYALASLGLRIFCVTGVGQCEQPRGRMYALASLGPRVFLRGRRGTIRAAKGSDVRPDVPRALRLFRGRCRTMYTAEGSDVRPGIPRAPRFLRDRRGTM